MITGRELLIDYDMKFYALKNVDEELQRVFSEQHVDEYLKNKEKL